jgi:16S rRNA C967 or C1407 C5-methylase (RsmB/RsmF family)
MTEPLYWGPTNLSGLAAEHLVAQNVPSALAVHELDPMPGDRVLDMCAAPGNKCAHIAARMKECGSLVALERSASRAKKLGVHMVELGHCPPFFQLFKMDACKAHRTELHQPADSTRSNNRKGGGGGSAAAVQFDSASFDRILLDAPCSGLGQRPRTSNVSVSLDLLQSTPRIQRKLFATAVGLLKPGGRLVYSTCTINPAENEAVVAWALSNYPALLALTPTLTRIEGSLIGLDGQGLTRSQREAVQRFDPRSDADTIGFFIATFTKT